MLVNYNWHWHLLEFLITVLIYLFQVPNIERTEQLNNTFVIS